MQKREEIRDAEMIRLKTFNKNHSIWNQNFEMHKRHAKMQKQDEIRDAETIQSNTIQFEIKNLRCKDETQKRDAETIRTKTIYSEPEIRYT